MVNVTLFTGTEKPFLPIENYRSKPSVCLLLGYNTMALSDALNMPFTVKFEMGKYSLHIYHCRCKPIANNYFLYCRKLRLT